MPLGPPRSRARRLIDGIPLPGPAAAPEDAVAGYARMLARGARPDAYTFPPLLKAVARAAGGSGSAAPARAVHAHVVRLGMGRNAHVASSLVAAYAAGGDGAAGRALVGERERDRDTPVVWNALISGHNRGGRFGESCCSFVDMARAGAAPTPVTYVSVLSACGKGTRDVLLGMQVHGRVVGSGVLPDLRVENALVDMYAECADMDSAWKVFDGMQSFLLEKYLLYNCLSLV